MFERSLSSLIKGLRSHRGKDEAKYVAALMEEIKHEIRSGDMHVKAEAVLKLTYLQMLGYSASNASFHMLEVMASPQFHIKSIGYLAASQCFSQDTEVLILATNLIKKDLRSPQYLDISVALNGLSHIITPDLAQHLGPDIVTLLSHTQASVRKKAILALLAVSNYYPPILEQALPRLNDKLQDSDIGVVSATVNILCELARRDTEVAKGLLPLSPQLFELLTTTTNNWMLIKIVKLFGVLTPLEPRLTRRLLPPISSLIQTTPAMSLLYECIHTVIIGGMLQNAEGDDLATTCTEKLGAFLDEDDQNLRYIALLGLIKILPTHAHLLGLHQEKILMLMDDEDLSIRMRALELVSGMITRENFVRIVEQQFKYLQPKQQSENISSSSAAQALRQAMITTGAPAAVGTDNSWITASYQWEIIRRILDSGSRDTYTNVADFEWYIDVLVKLNYVAGDSFGFQIASQLIDVSTRIRAVRPHAVYKVKQVLEDFTFLDQAKSPQRLSILGSAAWICGEYCQDVPYPPAIINLLLRLETLQLCSDAVVTAMAHNAVKLLAWWLLQASRDWKLEHLTTIKSVVKEVSQVMKVLSSSHNVEIHERAAEFVLLLHLIEIDLENKYDKLSSTSKQSSDDPKVQDSPLLKETSVPKSLQLLSPLFFEHTLGPVSKKAQSKVSVPENLNIEKWVPNPEKMEIVDNWGDETLKGKDSSKKSKKRSELTLTNDSAVEQRLLEKKEKARLRVEREKRQRESPFYLGSHLKQKEQKPMQTSAIEEAERQIDAIPVVPLELDTGSAIDEKSAEDTSKAIVGSKKVFSAPDQQLGNESRKETDKEQVLRKSVGRKKKRQIKQVDESMLQ